MASSCLEHILADMGATAVHTAPPPRRPPVRTFTVCHDDARQVFFLLGYLAMARMGERGGGEERDTKFSRSRLGSTDLEDNRRPCFASYDETRLLPLVRAQPPFMVL